MMFIICLSFVIYACRQHLRAKHDKLNWLAYWDDLVIPTTDDGDEKRLREDIVRIGNNETIETASLKAIEATDKRIYNRILPCGIYWKDKLYMARLSPKYRLPLSGKVQKDIERVKRLCKVDHENVAKFEGACLDADHVLVLYEYCPKGTLQVSSNQKEHFVQLLYNNLS